MLEGNLGIFQGEKWYMGKGFAGDLCFLFKCFRCMNWESIAIFILK